MMSSLSEAPLPSLHPTTNRVTPTACKCQLFIDVLHNEVCVGYYEVVQRYLENNQLDLSGQFERNVGDVIDRILAAYPFTAVQ
jgi:hypothetical protein